MKSIRNLCGLLLVLLSFSAARAEFRPGLAGIELDRVTLTVDRKILNPVHEKEAKGKLTLTVLVNQNFVRHSLGRVEGQDAGFPSDLVFTRRGTAHQEGGTTFFGSKISR